MNFQQAFDQLRTVDSKTARAAEVYLYSLDRLIGLYVHPTGNIAISGVKEGKAVYRVFQDY